MVTNISTISKGFKSLPLFMLLTQSAIQPLSEKKYNNDKVWASFSRKKKPDLLCKYDMIDGLKLCLDIVNRISADVFLHMRLCSGQDDENAENRSVRSSFLANSSTAGMWADKRNRTCEKKI